MRRDLLRRRVLAVGVGVALGGPPGVARAQWAAEPGTTVRNEFSPHVALCRGACGPDCPDTCEESFDWECVDSSHFRVVRTYECGTHPGCREHDDCLDRCAVEIPGSTEGGAFYYSECARACHAGCVVSYGAVSCGPWTKGHEAPLHPFDGSTRFEYTKNAPGDEEAVYRCPDGMRLACRPSGAECYPEPDPPDYVPAGRPVGVFVGPEPACLERGAEALTMHAAVVGLPGSPVRWSVVSGPGRIDPDSGRLTATGDGTVTVRAVSQVAPAFWDEADIEVGRCDCMVSAILSGDTMKTNAQGGVAHFSTEGGTTIMGAFSNPQVLDGALEMFGGVMGEEQGERAEEWKREMAKMPRETLGITLSEMQPGSGGEELLGQAFGGFKLQASVMNRPVEPGFAGGLPLSHVSLHTGEYTAGGYPTAYEWAPGAPGNVHLIVSHYNGRSLSGTITGNMFAPGLYKESSGQPPQISFSVSFYALEFDPMNLVMGCLTGGQ